MQWKERQLTCTKCAKRFYVSTSGEDPVPKRPQLESTDPGQTGGVTCPACGHHFQTVQPPREPDPKRRPTVLVAEDAAYFRELVRDTLGERFRTLLVSNKTDALKILRTENVDLFLLDLSLEDNVDGRDVLREMGSKPCPILIFTARDEREMYGAVWDELEQLGADDMLIKGMNVEENLLLKIERLLGERR